MLWTLTVRHRPAAPVCRLRHGMIAGWIRATARAMASHVRRVGEATASSNYSSRCSSAPQWQLPIDIQLHILSFLPPNDLALGGRLAFRAAADVFVDPMESTAYLSQPLPPHAAPWAVEAGQQHVRRLPFRLKPQLLCTAATSGGEVNLEVAWETLQPSFVPDELEKSGDNLFIRFPDPGVAAVEASHPQLLGWLLRHCPAVLGPNRVMRSAAHHCDLAGLREVWEALRSHPCSNTDSIDQEAGQAVLVDQHVLDAAAASAIPDAVAKMEWLLAVGAGEGPMQEGTAAGAASTVGSVPAAGRARGSCTLQESTAEAAARSGDLGRLRWLRERGCPMGGYWVLQSALQHADLAVAQWLVNEAGCEMPTRGPVSSIFQPPPAILASIRGPDGVAKLQWLQGRGFPALSRRSVMLRGLARAGVREGRLEMVRHLVSLCGQDKVASCVDGNEAARSGSVAMAELLHQAGVAFNPRAYEGAAEVGSVAVVRWLAAEVGVSAAGLPLHRLIGVWPSYTPAHSRDLLEAVRLLVERAGCTLGVASGDALREGAARGDLALVQYLLLQGPSHVPVARAVAGAAEAGCIAVLELLEEQLQCQAWPRAVRVSRGDQATQNLLQQRGVPSSVG